VVRTQPLLSYGHFRTIGAVLASAPVNIESWRGVALQGDGDVAGLGLRGEDGIEGLEGALLGNGECEFNDHLIFPRCWLLKKFMMVSL
jgi:hypothetical protein